jgi:hypothetical protein
MKKLILASILAGFSTTSNAVDTQKPVILWQTLSNNVTIVDKSEGTFGIAIGSFDNEGVEHTEIFIDDVLVYEVYNYGGYFGNIDVSGVPGGSIHKITVSLEDYAGNKTVESRYAIVLEAQPYLDQIQAKNIKF